MYLRLLYIAAIFFLLASSSLAQHNDFLAADEQHERRILSLADDDDMPDARRLALLDCICREHYSIDTVFAYANKELDLALALDNSEYEAKAWSYLFWCNYKSNQILEANRCACRALSISDSIGDVALMAQNYHNLAVTFALMQNATKANELSYKALDLYIQLRDSDNITSVLRDIGRDNCNNDLVKEAVECYRRALAIDSVRLNSEGLAEDHLGLGATYFARFSKSLEREPSLLALARQEYVSAYSLSRLIGHEAVQLRVCAELPPVLMAEADLRPADSSLHDKTVSNVRMFLNMGYRLARHDGNRLTVIDLDFIRLNHLIFAGLYPQAMAVADSLRSVIDSADGTLRTYNESLYAAYSRIYEYTGRLNLALDAQRLAYQHHLHNKQNDYAIAAAQSLAQAQYDEQLLRHKQDAERREHVLETETRHRTIEVWTALAVLALVLVLGVVLIRSYLSSRHLVSLLDSKNSELKAQKLEISSQNEHLERQTEQIARQSEALQRSNRELTDSINYALLIQQAAMPTSEAMTATWGDHLLLMRPLNIVSGDFFWISSVGQYKFLAVADCTGHGVPGAFLSMLGTSILDYLAPSVMSDGPSAGYILTLMRTMLMQSLHQDDRTSANHDGMDIGLIIFDTKSTVVHYAGAMRPLIVVRDGQVVKYDADRMPIGVHYHQKSNFSDNVIDVRSGDVLYLFSDGITDQFGYADDGSVRKFSARRFRSLLADIAAKPFDIQKRLIDDAVDRWRSQSKHHAQLGPLYPQTDDNIVVGVRIP